MKPHIVSASLCMVRVFVAVEAVMLMLLLRRGGDMMPSSPAFGGVREPGELSPEPPLQPGLLPASVDILFPRSNEAKRPHA